MPQCCELQKRAEEMRRWFLRPHHSNIVHSRWPQVVEQSNVVPGQRESHTIKFDHPVPHFSETQETQFVNQTVSNQVHKHLTSVRRIESGHLVELHLCTVGLKYNHWCFNKSLRVAVMHFEHKQSQKQHQYRVKWMIRHHFETDWLTN